MSGMTLTEFLLARFAEDEADARKATEVYGRQQWSAHPEETGQPIKAGGFRIATCGESVMPHIARHDPARVLAECEAKRRIVELHAVDHDEHHPVHEHSVDGYDATENPCPTLRILAAPYADHPDYDTAWGA